MVSVECGECTVKLALNFVNKQRQGLGRHQQQTPDARSLDALFEILLSAKSFFFLFRLLLLSLFALFTVVSSLPEPKKKAVNLQALRTDKIQTPKDPTNQQPTHRQCLFFRVSF